jgi:hypothetical protein
MSSFMYRGPPRSIVIVKSCRKHSSLKGHLWKLLTRARDSRPRRGELWTDCPARHWHRCARFLLGGSPPWPASGLSRPSLTPRRCPTFLFCPLHPFIVARGLPLFSSTLYCIVVLIMSRTRACSPQSRVTNTERQQRNSCARSVASSSDTDAWWIGEREHNRERPKRLSEWIQLRRSQNIITLLTTSFLWRTALSPLISLFINDTLFTKFLTGSCRRRCP